MDDLLQQIRICDLCAKNLPLGAHPIIQASCSSKFLIIGQAPGSKVHHSGIPWNDASGAKLRAWLEMDKTTFYDEKKVAIMPMGFCYPGKGSSGDNPPRPECAPTWHEALLSQLEEVELTLLIGQYAQNYYLNSPPNLKIYKTVTDRVKHVKEYPSNLFPLPHPSPRNRIWLNLPPSFETETLTLLRQKIWAMGL